MLLLKKGKGVETSAPRLLDSSVQGHNGRRRTKRDDRDWELADVIVHTLYFLKCTELFFTVFVV